MKQFNFELLITFNYVTTMQTIALLNLGNVRGRCRKNCPMMYLPSGQLMSFGKLGENFHLAVLETAPTTPSNIKIINTNHSSTITESYTQLRALLLTLQQRAALS